MEYVARLVEYIADPMGKTRFMEYTAQATAYTVRLSEYPVQLMEYIARLLHRVGQERPLCRRHGPTLKKEQLRGKVHED